MSKPEIYVGQSVVASWLGVQRAAVSNWINARHTGTIPAPDVVITSAEGGEILGWSPGRRAEWQEWYRAMHETNPRGPRRNRYVTPADRESWQ